tara:strand:+ start:5087 stop:6682 length:1596 start_codon:yes stop_codon:yes gene_type:complete
MSLRDLIEQAVRENTDRARRTQDLSMEYTPSAGQMANFSGMFAPGAALLDAKGQYSSMGPKDQPFSEAFSNPPNLSILENIESGGLGGYGMAGAQALGVLGDATYAAPFIGAAAGPTIGSLLKFPAAMAAVAKTISSAGKGGITSLKVQKAQDLINQGKATAGTQEATQKMVTPTNVEKGKIIDVRKNLNSSFDDPDLAKFKAQTIHDVKTLKSGKISDSESNIGTGTALSYDPAVTVKSNGVPIELKVNQKARDSIASKTKPKFPMASVRGIYDDLDIFEPDLTLGFNPMKQNVFVDPQGYGVKSIINGKASIVDNDVLVKLDNPNSFRTINEGGNEIKLYDDIEYYGADNLPKTNNPSQVNVIDADKGIAALKPDTSYRMQHQARGLEPDAIRLDDLTKDISGNQAGYPDDFYSSQGQRIYAPGKRFADDEYGLANTESYNAITKARGNPEAEVTIYRAVPKGIKNINEGDFVTLSPKYAELHGLSGYGSRGDEAGEVISQKVKVKDLIWDANDVNEFGYFPISSTTNP